MIRPEIGAPRATFFPHPCRRAPRAGRRELPDRHPNHPNHPSDHPICLGLLCRKDDLRMGRMQNGRFSSRARSRNVSWAHHRRFLKISGPGIVAYICQAPDVPKKSGPRGKGWRRFPQNPTNPPTHRPIPPHPSHPQIILPGRKKIRFF